MRQDNESFNAANIAQSKRPRYVIGLYFDNDNTDIVYLTSHKTAKTPAGATVISGVVKSFSGVSQKINPDKGNSTIGAFSFSVLDFNNQITELIRDKLNAGDGLRRKRVVCWVGYEGLLWEEYTTILTYIIDNVTYKNAVYKFSCSDIQRISRKNIFDLNTTTLTEDVSAKQDFLPVSLSDLTLFKSILHDSSYSDRPNQKLTYVLIDKEVIAVNGFFTHNESGLSLQVIQRGALNTLAAFHDSDSNKYVLSRKKVTEHVFLSGPAPKVAYQILTGHVAENLLSYSEQFSDASWVKINSTISSDVRVSPDGLTTADRLNVNTTNSYHALEKTLTGLTTNEAVTASIFIADDGAGYGFLTIYYGADFVSIVIDLQTGEITNETEGGNVKIKNMGTVGLAFGFRVFISVVILSGTTATFMVGSANSATPTYVGRAPSYAATVGDDIFLWGAQFSETNYLVPYFKTTTSAQAKETLPKNWHLGVTHELVRLQDYTRLGNDIWNPYTNEGRQVRFEGLTRTDGKLFIETEIMLWMAAFMPIYSNGQIGLKQLQPVLSESSYVAELNEENIVSYTDLKHDYNSVINQIALNWNYVFSKKDFTKTSILIDAQSIAKHNDAPPKELKLLGVGTAAHTDEALLSYFDSMRDRYSGPPERLSLNLLPSLNRLEVGDVVNVNLKQIRDFNKNSGVALNRAFEVQQVGVNWITGDFKVDLFGSSQKAGELVRSALSTVVDDSYYDSEGTDLSTVLTISGNAITANGTIAGGDTMPEGVYYYLGNLTLNSGVIAKFTRNTYLKIRGHLTVNGEFDGEGAGYLGHTGSGNIGDLKHFSNKIGHSGYLGTTMSGASVHIENGIFTTYVYSHSSSTPTKGVVDALPIFEVTNKSTSLLGLPQNLMGTSGGGGGPAVETVNTSVVTETVVASGGDGGNSGAGLMILCRGMSFGAGGKIKTSGLDGSPGSSYYNASNNAPGVGIQSGAGAGGAPGGLLVLIDGNNTSPALSSSNVISNLGNSPNIGERVHSVTANVSSSTLYTSEVVGFAGYNMGKSAYNIQYLPPVANIDAQQSSEAVISESFLQTWTARRSATQGTIMSVAYGNGVLVSVGVNSSSVPFIQTSTGNGNSWTLRTVPGTVSDLFDVVYGNGTFVVVGRGSGSNGYIATSTNGGVTWVERTHPRTGLAINAVAFNNSLFVAVGEADSGVPVTYIITSTDGVVWVDESPLVFYNNARKIIWGNDEWMVFASSIITSPDATNWAQRGTTSISLYNDLTWDGKQYVAVTQAGVYGDGVYTSADGNVWKGSPTPFDSALLAVDYGQGVYVATGSPYSSNQTVILTSRDAINWTSVNPPTNIPNTLFRDVLFVNNFFIAVGNNVDATYGAAVLTSLRVDF